MYFYCKVLVTKYITRGMYKWFGLQKLPGPGDNYDVLIMFSLVLFCHNVCRNQKKGVQLQISFSFKNCINCDRLMKSSYCN